MTSRPSCAGCGALLRSARQWICRPCLDAAWAAFKAAHQGVGPTEWQRAYNRTYGDRDALLAFVNSQRAR